jgi:hypothetical protein
MFKKIQLLFAVAFAFVIDFAVSLGAMVDAALFKYQVKQGFILPMYSFGAGSLFGTPLTDASGAAITNGTPVQFGTLQDISLDVSFDVKELYGSLQFPVAVGRGKGKITGKAKQAQINGSMWNELFFGQTLNSGGISDYIDTIGAAIPATPFTITPTYPNSGVWSVDLGVKDANGIAMTKVASAPATGQYSVTAGAYLFAAADTGLKVFISAQYTYTSTSAVNQSVSNVIMGQAPTFQAEFYSTYGGKSIIVTLPNCIGTKLSMATKLDDFLIPEFDFSAFASANGTAMKWALSDK